MQLNSKKQRKVPELNTSALPDLIFTVLFFFMIVTHMRQTDVKVKVETPQGTELQKIQKKYATSYLYIGKGRDGRTQLQFNDRILSVAQLAAAVSDDRNLLPLDEQQYYTVSIKADSSTPLDVIADVKEALREANALQVNYSATQTLNTDNTDAAQQSAKHNRK